MTNLRKVGGSVMLAIPPDLLKLVNLQVNDDVKIGVENGRIIIGLRIRPSYTLDELLAPQCNEEDFVLTAEDRAWDEAKPVGKELL